MSPPDRHAGGPRRSARGADRGQTLHDFALGMVVFLLVLGYVFAFVPTLFAPFAPQTDSSPVRADRTADHLTRDVLVENGSTSGPLNVTCTEAFFRLDPANASTPPDGCRFAADADLDRIAALPAETELNVTMRRGGGIAAPNGVVLAEGPTPGTSSGRVIDATRIVSFDGKDYRFVVKIW